MSDVDLLRRNLRYIGDVLRHNDKCVIYAQAGVAIAFIAVCIAGIALVRTF